MYPYQLTRSRRKSLSICIERDGTIHVKAPNWLPRSQIDQFVREKSTWIEQKRAELKALEEKKRSHTFEAGDQFCFLGETYRLQVQRQPFPQDSASKGVSPESIVLKQGEKVLSVTLPFPGALEVRKQVEEWYLLQAKRIFPERVAVYYPAVARQAMLMMLEGMGTVNRITIRSQKTRWGSCSSKGNLNFNWRLIMASIEIVDYVVVHELCHLACLNHSPQFWQLVEAVLPDYAQRRSWLRENGMLLCWEE